MDETRARRHALRLATRARLDTPSTSVSTAFTSVGGDDTRVFFVGGFSIMSSSGAVTTLPFGNLNGVFGFGNTVWAASSGGRVLRNGG